jgi:CRP-like cAMP-binding protein
LLNIEYLPNKASISPACHIDGRPQRFRAHEYIVRGGHFPTRLHIIQDGWAARYKLLHDGRRQITAIYMKGDLCDPTWLSPVEVPQPVVAMSALKTIALQADDIHRCANRNPELSEVIWSEARATFDMQAEWILNLGRKSARERLAYLFCEIAVRLGQSETRGAARCDMPLTQNEIADFTGLTSVHVNRTLKGLRRENLIELCGHRLHIPDIALLARIALFSRENLRAQRTRVRDFVALQIQ